MKTRRATVSFKTVGCRLNQAETAVIRASFEEAGYSAVSFGMPCDVCVIHGCVVTSKAEEDSLRLARSIKRRHPNVFVVLAGCAAELLSNESTASDGRAGQTCPAVHSAAQAVRPYLFETNIRKYTGADFLAGQKEKFSLPEILGTRFQTAEKRPPMPAPRFNTQRAIVKIQDGCDSKCAYCIVPRVRGASRSRPAAEIIDEITRLTLCGFPEIVLTGANIGRYADGNCRFVQLLEKVELVPGLKRFRISSLEISTAEFEVIDFMTSSKKMCRFLHLPLQSGSDKILKTMGRPYTADKFSAVVQYARAQLGQIGLGTDIIVGFPGETDDDFLATERMVRQLPFSKLHVFGYSPRPGTPAGLMPGQVSAQDKAGRVARLIELGREKRKVFAQSLVGKPVAFLVEKILPDGWAEGWTGEYIRAKVKTNSLRLKQITRFVPESARDDVLFRMG